MVQPQECQCTPRRTEQKMGRLRVAYTAMPLGVKIECTALIQRLKATPVCPSRKKLARVAAIAVRMAALELFAARLACPSGNLSRSVPSSPV
jgi:hypothetical protein